MPSQSQLYVPALTLADSVWPVGEDQGKLVGAFRGVVLSVIGSLLIWASAKIQLPFYPVPMTMQTFVILSIGMAYGWRLGAATVLLYLAEGVMGLPVFSGSPEKGVGLAYMLGGTGGYLFGFLLAATVTGALAERGWDRSFATTALAMLIGNAVIYIPGLVWLGTLFGWDKPILAWGMVPFLTGDLTKLALAAVILPLVWKLPGLNKS